GGLRIESLRQAEELALGFYYWLVAGTTDDRHPDFTKPQHLNQRLLTGTDSPLGTEHGLSKYPYIREARRIIGRPAYGYPAGFSISEVSFSRHDFREAFYDTELSANDYRLLWLNLARQHATGYLANNTPADQMQQVTRAHIFPDSVGITQYAIDFHPCMEFSPPQKPDNRERPGTRQAQGKGGMAYPAEIPLRALIPQQIDNLLIAGKSIATSHIAAATYRIHNFEWSVGAGAATTADFALIHNVLPQELVDELPSREPLLEQLRSQLSRNGNPTQFPGTSIFNQDWSEW
ncbi:MAG: FAD-dependent oxidoreductase, partial [Cyanobacteria bacterium P01_H01_bin.121]